MAAPPPSAAYPGRGRPAPRAHSLGEATCKQTPSRRPGRGPATPAPPPPLRPPARPPAAPPCRTQRPGSRAPPGAAPAHRPPPGLRAAGVAPRCPRDAPSRGRGSQRTAVLKLCHYINAAPERGRCRPALPRTRRAVIPLRRLCPAAFGAEPPVGHQHARAQRPRTPTGHPRPSRAFKQVANGGSDYEPERQRNAGPAEPFSPFPGSPSARTPRAAGQDGALLSSALAAGLAFLVKARAAPAGRRLEETTPPTLRSARAPSLQPLLTARTAAPGRRAPLRDRTPPAPRCSPAAPAATPPRRRSGAEGPLAPSPSRRPGQPGTHLCPSLPPSPQPPSPRAPPPPAGPPGPPEPRPPRCPAAPRSPAASPEPSLTALSGGRSPARPGPAPPCGPGFVCLCPFLTGSRKSRDSTLTWPEGAGTRGGRREGGRASQWRVGACVT
ncbi:uncharacterized protein [Sylvia atricapilla]|uniref:uncharacterized protein n=1 Tax=Sylvia atricapilla TaxID=48155 RepID=UPI00339234C3